MRKNSIGALRQDIDKLQSDYKNLSLRLNILTTVVIFYIAWQIF